MKKNIVSKLLSITLASCLIIGGVSFGGIKSVNAAGKSDTLYLKASDMKRGKVSYYDTINESLDLSDIDSSYEKYYGMPYTEILSSFSKNESYVSHI